MSAFKHLPPHMKLMMLCFGASQLSEAIFRIAIAWWLLDVTKSSSLFGALIAASNLAMVLTHAFLGWLGDKYRRSALLGVFYLLDAFSALTIIVIAFTANNPDPILIAALLIVGTISNTASGPLHSSAALEASKPHEAKVFVQHRTSISSACMIIGPALAGIIISAFGARCAMVLHVSVLASLFALIRWQRFKYQAGLHARNEIENGSTTSGILLLLSGWKALWRIKAERVLCFQSFLSNAALYPLIAVVLPVLVKDQRSYPAWALGACSSVFGIGALFGSVTVVNRLKKLEGRYLIAGAGRAITIFALVFAAILVVTPALSADGRCFADLAALGFLGISGIGFSLVNVAVGQVRSLATPNAYRNRLMSSSAALVTLGIPVGSFSIGMVLERFGIGSALLVCLVLLIFSSVIMLCAQSSKALLQMADDALAEAYARQLERF